MALERFWKVAKLDLASRNRKRDPILVDLGDDAKAGQDGTNRRL